MSKKSPHTPRRRLRPEAKIEPLHVDELLAGAGMSGFLGVLDRNVTAPHLQQLVDGMHAPVAHPVSVPEQIDALLDRLGLRPETEAESDDGEISGRVTALVERLDSLDRTGQTTK